MDLTEKEKQEKIQEGLKLANQVWAKAIEINPLPEGISEDITISLKQVFVSGVLVGLNHKNEPNDD